MVNKTLKRVVTFGLTVALALTAVGCGSTDSAEEIFNLDSSFNR